AGAADGASDRVPDLQDARLDVERDACHDAGGEVVHVGSAGGPRGKDEDGVGLFGRQRRVGALHEPVSVGGPVVVVAQAGPDVGGRRQSVLQSFDAQRAGAILLRSLLPAANSAAPAEASNPISQCHRSISLFKAGRGAPPVQSVSDEKGKKRRFYSRGPK